MRSKIITHLYTTQIETKKTLEKKLFFFSQMKIRQLGTSNIKP